MSGTYILLGSSGSSRETSGRMMLRSSHEARSSKDGEEDMLGSVSRGEPEGLDGARTDELSAAVVDAHKGHISTSAHTRAAASRAAAPGPTLEDQVTEHSL